MKAEVRHDHLLLKKKAIFSDKIREQMKLQSMVLPGIIYLFIFAYIPLAGIVIAFKEFDLYTGIMNSPWVGMRHFITFFTHSDFGLLMKNTLSISFLKLLLGFPTPIILAIMLNEVKNIGLRRVFQTIAYMPHFMSWVIVSGMILSLLAVDGGTVNTLLEKMGLIHTPVNWLSTPKYFWTILISSNIWKETGFGAIIFIAAITGVNPELYEAASIDGASRFRQIFIVTLPSILPQIIVMLILSISRIMNAGFDDILLLTNNGENNILRDVSDVVDTFVYRVGIKTQRFSYAAAVGLFKSVVSIAMLVLANRFAKKVSDASLW